MKSKTMDTLRRNLSVKDKLGYGIAALGDTVAYDFTDAFLLYFLTDLAGVSPVYAGIIIMIAVIWDGITDPIVGIMSDHSKCRYGKKRPFILAGAIPLGVCLWLRFTGMNFGDVGNIVYYTILGMIFWTAYTVFQIPYHALGAALTYDSEERTQLSAFRAVFSEVGYLFASAIPLFIVGALRRNGISETSAWSIISAILGVFVIGTILISWRATRGKEICDEVEEGKSIKVLLGELKDIITQRPYRIIIFMSLLFFLARAMDVGSAIYFAYYVLGVPEEGLAVLYIVETIASITFTVVLAGLSTKFDKKYIAAICMIIAGVSLIMGQFIGITTLFQFCVLAVFFCIATSAYWTFCYPLLYDIVEINDFKTGDRKESMTICYYEFFMKIGSAIAAFGIGWALELSGYDEELEVQAESALDMIISLSLSYPGIVLILTGLVIFMYPITIKRHKALTEALELKKQGKEYSTEGFEKLL